MIRRRVRTRTLAIGVLLAGTGLAVPQGPAGADPVHAASGTFHCGDTIVLNPVTPVVLAADVGPCAPGLEVGGLKVVGSGVLDLANKTVSGTDTTTSCTAAAPDNDTLDETGEGAGIYVANGVGVTIRNGTVTGFDAGVVIDGGSTNVVEDIITTYNKGIGEFPTDFGDGIVVRASTNNIVRDNTVSCNGPYGGITLYAAAGNTVHHNVITDNAVPEDGHVAQQTDGIRLENGATANTIRNNEVSGSGLDGIAILNPGGANTVRANTVTTSGRHGIAVFGQPNTIGGPAPADGNTVSTSTGSDLFDATTGCGLNSWANNSGTGNQICAT